MLLPRCPAAKRRANALVFTDLSRRVLLSFLAVLSWLLLIVVLSAVVGGGTFGVVRVLNHRKDLLPDGSYKRDITGTLKILMNFLQTISFLSDFDLEWPETISGSMNSRHSLMTRPRVY
jgi:hypothetical protein